MPPRSSVYQLPKEILEELNTKLVGSGFGGYRELAEWLKSQGYRISKSALHSYGQDFEQEFKASMADARKAQELARAAVAQRDDSGAALLEATSDVAQEALLKLMIAIRKAESEPRDAAKLLSLAVRSLADLGRMTIDQRKWAEQIKRQIQEEADAKLVRLEAEAKTGKGKLDAETLRIVRQEVYGLV
ncbi:MAG TPA: phage protein Gp27 family protein [Methylococcus sp.]|nr:phage protein Gp27 family protein [Methylococcus sp.]